CVHESQEIRDAHEVNRGGIELRSSHYARERGITTIAATVDSDAVTVCDALVYQPMHAISNVILHGEPPLAEAGFPKLAPITRRTAKIHLQNTIASVRQELGFGVETPAVAHPWPAVRVDHTRQVFRLAPLG